MAVSQGIATGSTPRWPTVDGAWTSVRQRRGHQRRRIVEVTQEHLQKALPLLNDGGSIILNSSNPNAEDNYGIGVYAAIKAALRTVARHLGK